MNRPIDNDIDPYQVEMNKKIAKLQERVIAVLDDPVSEQTRKVRRALLGFSAAGILAAKGRIIPKKISAFGLEFQDLNQEAIVSVSAMIMIFFVLSFFIYSVSDFQLIRIKFRAYRGDLKTVKADAGDWFRKEITRRSIWWNATISLRYLWEYIIPLNIGIYAAFALYAVELPTL